eukprot:9603894-Alexandrium_andersonii.AAC.1
MLKKWIGGSSLDQLSALGLAKCVACSAKPRERRTYLGRVVGPSRSRSMQPPCTRLALDWLSGAGL